MNFHISKIKKNLTIEMLEPSTQPKNFFFVIPRYIIL